MNWWAREHNSSVERNLAVLDAMVDMIRPTHHRIKISSEPTVLIYLQDVFQWTLAICYLQLEAKLAAAEEELEELEARAEEEDE